MVDYRIPFERCDEIKLALLSHIGYGNALDKDWMRKQVACAPTRQMLFDAVDAIAALQFDLIDKERTTDNAARFPTPPAGITLQSVDEFLTNAAGQPEWSKEMDRLRQELSTARRDAERWRCYITTLTLHPEDVTKRVDGLIAECRALAGKAWEDTRDLDGSSSLHRLLLRALAEKE